MITNERAAGSIAAMAAGDALGAGYEFGPPLPDDQVVLMAGGGVFAWQPGEWTDDTSMAIPILQALARRATRRCRDPGANRRGVA
jgi:ADP-ribosyl-[dinitrogen reductase] hydrolase